MPTIKNPRGGPPPMRKLIKPKRAAAIIDRSLRYIYYLEERGEIEFVRDGKAASVVAESLDRYIERLRERAARKREEEATEEPT